MTEGVLNTSCHQLEVFVSEKLQLDFNSTRMLSYCKKLQPIQWLFAKNHSLFKLWFLRQIIKTCSYHLNLFRRNMEIISFSRPNLYLSEMVEYLSIWCTPHIHLNILILAWAKANTFSFLTGVVSLPYNTQLLTQYTKTHFNN